MRPEFFTNRYGLIVDYLAEFFREMRKRSFSDAIDRFFKLGNNLNQLAKSLNILRQDSNAISNFSFLECFHALSQMQNDLHHWLGQLPKIERSPEAVSRARERALKKGRAVDVH